MDSFNSDSWRTLKRNNIYRYHFLDSDGVFLVPDLVIDFKHFFTIPREVIYERAREKYLATLGSLFRENLSLRFSQYLNRIGLPDIEPK